MTDEWVLGDNVCGICGKPATCWFRNIKPIEIQDEQTGELVGGWEYIGEGQFRCEKHKNIGFVDTLTLSQRRLQNICGMIARMRMTEMQNNTVDKETVKK